jgi:hypothetical protein
MSQEITLWRKGDRVRRPIQQQMMTASMASVQAHQQQLINEQQRQLEEAGGCHPPSSSLSTPRSDHKGVEHEQNDNEQEATSPDVGVKQMERAGSSSSAGDVAASSSGHENSFPDPATPETPSDVAGGAKTPIAVKESPIPA